MLTWVVRCGALTLPAPAKEKIAGTESKSIAAFTARFSKLELRENVRNVASLVLFVTASAFWLASIGRMEQCQEALPWYVCIGLAASYSVRFLKIEKPMLALVGMPKNHEPLHLQESLSACFLVAALSLYIWVGYSLVHVDTKSARLAQVVDIQLLSDRDFKNNNEMLPGSAEHEEVRKRQADMISQAGNLAKSKSVEVVTKTEQKEKTSQNPDRKTVKSDGKTKVERQDEKKSEHPSTATVTEQKLQSIAVAPLMVPSTWQTKEVKQFAPAAARPKSPAPVQSNQPYITEVEPPELVELMENDGSTDAMHVFQKGGKSAGGKGAENGLSVYLKELHRKIKNAWQPPMGTNRQVVVMFRLKRDGHLDFVKVDTSSGEPETDKSACKAVVLATSTNQALPKDFSNKYLDLLYTFNYNVNELRELNSASAD